MCVLSLSLSLSLCLSLSLSLSHTHTYTHLYALRRGRVPAEQRRLRQQAQLHEHAGIDVLWRLPSWVCQRRREGLQGFVCARISLRNRTSATTTSARALCLAVNCAHAAAFTHIYFLSPNLCIRASVHPFIYPSIHPSIELRNVVINKLSTTITSATTCPLIASAVSSVKTILPIRWDECSDLLTSSVEETFMKMTNAISAKATCSSRRRRLEAGQITVTVVGRYRTDTDAIEASRATFEDLFHKKFERELKAQRPETFLSLLVENVTSSEKTLKCFDFFTRVSSVKVCNSCTGPERSQCTVGVCAPGYEKFNTAEGKCEVRCYDFATRVEEVEACNSCTGPERSQCIAGVCAPGYENFLKTRGTCEPIKCNCPNGKSTVGTNCTQTACESCKKGFYLVDGKCERCPQPNHPNATCLACTRHGKCIETECQSGFYPSWRGSWSLGYASCQKDNYCTAGACGSAKNKCFSVATGEFVCHCAKGFSGGFPYPNKACFEFDACVDPPHPRRKVDCGGLSQCLPQPQGNFKCECADGSNAGVLAALAIVLH